MSLRKSVLGLKRNIAQLWVLVRRASQVIACFVGNSDFEFGGFGTGNSRGKAVRVERLKSGLEDSDSRDPNRV